MGSESAGGYVKAANYMSQVSSSHTQDLSSMGSGSKQMSLGSHHLKSQSSSDTKSSSKGITAAGLNRGVEGKESKSPSIKLSTIGNLVKSHSRFSFKKDNGPVASAVSDIDEEDMDEGRDSSNHFLGGKTSSDTRCFGQSVCSADDEVDRICEQRNTKRKNYTDVSQVEVPRKFRAEAHVPPGTHEENVDADNSGQSSGTEWGIRITRLTTAGQRNTRFLSISADNRFVVITSSALSSTIRSLKFMGNVRGLKKKHQCRKVDIASISRIQRGQFSSQWDIARGPYKGFASKGSPEEQASLSFFLYDGSSMDIVTESKSDYMMLLLVMNDLVSAYRASISTLHPDALLMQYVWTDLELDPKTIISAAEVLQVFGRLNIPIKKFDLNAVFRANFPFFSEGKVSFERCTRLMKYVRSMNLKMSSATDPSYFIAEQVQAKDEIGDSAGNISIDSFLDFLRTSQKEDKVTPAAVKNLFVKLNLQFYGNKELEWDPTEFITKEVFQCYLHSDANDAFEPTSTIFGRNDMSRPLSHYWINSSHDTYFMDQNKSKSSVSMYLKALNCGVRCIEIDVWDGGVFYSNEPIVCSSEEAQQKILFHEIIKGIKSFLTDNPKSYPIILFIENHCSPPYHFKMTKYMKGILGGSLHVPRAVDGPLPSPAKLMGKVVIKGKRPVELREGATILNDDYDVDIAAEKNIIEETDEIPGLDTVESFVSETQHDPNLSLTPSELQEFAEQEAQRAISEAKDAEDEAFHLQVKANQAEEHASKLLAVSGMSLEEIGKQAHDFMSGKKGQMPFGALSNSVRGSAKNGYNPIRDREASPKTQNPNGSFNFASSTLSSHSEHSENDDDNVKPITSYEHAVQERCVDELEISFIKSSDDDDKLAYEIEIDTVGSSFDDDGDDIEKMLPGVVVNAKKKNTVAQEEADKAIQEAANAMANFQQVAAKFSTLEEEVERSLNNERNAVDVADDAEEAVERCRESLQETERRVIDLRKQLEINRRNLSTAEGAATTALTEAEISNQRACEAEKRALKAKATSDADRLRAEAETSKETKAERDAVNMQRACGEAAKALKVSRQKREQAAANVVRDASVVKSLEESPEGQLELSGHADRKDPQVKKFASKYKNKLDAHRHSQMKLQESEELCRMYEMECKKSQHSFDATADKTTEQCEVAKSAREQADQSSYIAEQLEELATEERDAADLRQVASEKADRTVKRCMDEGKATALKISSEEKAHEDYVRKLSEYKDEAEHLAEEVVFTNIKRQEACAKLDDMRKDLDAAKAANAKAQQAKNKLTGKAKELQKVATSAMEVFNRAVIEKVETERKKKELGQAQKNALAAHEHATKIRTQATQAKLMATVAVNRAAEKVAASRHAKVYREKKAKVRPIDASYARLILLSSSKFKDFKISENNSKHNMHSICESQVGKLLRRDKDNFRNWVKYNKSHLTRVFPSVSRTDSSNFNPVLCWATGSQIVSMNSQTNDSSLRLNYGRFRENGSSGYVLKPDRLLKGIRSELQPEYGRKLKIRVVSGARLPIKSTKGWTAVDPYVEVVVYDGPPGDSSKRHKTKPAQNNGLNPVWNENVASSFSVVCPSVAMVAFTVYEWHDSPNGMDDFIACSSIPFSCLREGIRSVPLYDANHQRGREFLVSSLLVEIKIE